ncbi:MAG: cyclic pyranopterin monophosphate synthase MoaC [Dehalococcoidia bacterium]|nr:cyclic pyranopterin monophosphate synthase MoaC [Dehalococcoidia bacterium]|tara:strand:- start:383 stop:865 length:483 start_codon:yes stop_codon:yes gene_type:complete
MEHKNFSHIDNDGSANMVDISSKKISKREAIASSEIIFNNETYLMIKDNQMTKGNVINIAQLAGITASKKTHDLIPLCHQIPINKVDLSFEFDDANNKISIISYVSSDWKTGVEMEALVAVSVASLTIYDMCKSLDKSIIINKIQLEKKTGGKSGTYIRD